MGRAEGLHQRAWKDVSVINLRVPSRQHSAVTRQYSYRQRGDVIKFFYGTVLHNVARSLHVCVKLHLKHTRTKRHVRLYVVSVRSVHPIRGTKRDAS